MRADISASPRRARRRRLPFPSAPPATGRAAAGRRAPCPTCRTWWLRRGTLRRHRATGIPRAAEIKRLARTAPAWPADRRFARHRHLATAECARRAGRVGILAGIEGITATAATCLRGCRVLHDRRGRRDLRLLVVAGLGLRIALRLARPLLRITLLRIALLPLRRARLRWRR